MGEFIEANEAYVRLGAFLGVFLVMAGWEALLPRRPLTVGKGRRWAHNLAVTFIDTAVVRLLLAAGATGFALMVSEKKLGVLNMAALPGWADFVIAFLFLDFAIYLQHAMFHFIPTLWRMHMVHHTDLDLDVTSGLRFHPLEIVVSTGIKLAAILFIGAPASAVLVFEVVLNATAMFNHGNVAFNKKVDKALRLLVVTPEMHRVHHSVIINEFNSNFGFNLPWWDRIFGTYRAQPLKGHLGMTIGLARHRSIGRLGLLRLMVLPFTSETRQR